MAEACPLCAGGEVFVLHRAVPALGSRHPSRFDVEGCRACGLRWTSPQPTLEELRAAYGAAYTWQDGSGLVARAEALYRRTLVRIDQARAAHLACEIAGGRRFLDIGCGDGLLISEARRLGIEAFGVDRPGAPLWPGCDPGWRREGDVESLEQPQGAWDVVSLFHVAEHLRAPVDLFRRAHAWLRPGGVLLLQVPNAGSLQAELFGARWYGWDVPRHLVHWSPATLARALAAAGFEVARVRHVSWRDNGPCLASSIAPQLDPLIERERAHAGRPRPAVVTLLRRLAYMALVWGSAPLALAEAALGRGATVTVFARRL